MPRFFNLSLAGLDPAIHDERHADPRVKPGDDAMLLEE
jgi:hypothetical protein